ncbi:MAG: glycosyltransferase family 2 protein [Myxococcales bacterium]|nr:glycosyltransferase family 2 protein [Myxococcales bacterium]
MMITDAQRPSLSLVIPAYNEAARIGPTLARVTAFLDARAERYEVIVVDDGSRDATRDVVTAIARERPRVRLLPLPANAGKGAAVRAGVLASRGRDVLFSDADLSTPIEELERLEAALRAGADVAIGSRAVPGDVHREQPLLRRLQGRGFHLVVRALGFRAVAAIRDTQCGFKLFRGPVARALFGELTLAGFAFDVELLELAHDRFRIAEVPVAWTHADGSKVRPGVDALRMLRDLTRIRWGWLRRGRPALGLPAGEQVR